jgi:UDP-N-acetylglucosamine 1-carboxyvinyltransferase
MSKLVINGPCKLSGEFTVSGSKNASLPIICATLLASGIFKITNIPEISDIKNLLEIISKIGGKYTLENNTLTIDTGGINSFEPDPKKVRNIRASILLLGPLLSRFKEVKIAYPGGCFIGARPVETHIRALSDLGAEIVECQDSYHLRCEELKGTKIILNEISVTGTENAIMAAVLANGETEIRLAACEPHVEDLCNFLNKMGAKISGIGTHNIKIVGVSKLKAIEYSVIPDQIEAGTIAIAAAASRGDLIIRGYIQDHQDILTKKFEEIGVNYKLLNNNSIHIKPTHNFRPTKIRTDIYPGFPTDLQAPISILLTQASGNSEVYETLFEGRLNYINELNKMGANGIIKSAHEAIITGPTPLFGTDIVSLDLRAGATLIIAAFIASGESTINQAEIIDRGYEKIDERLNAIGANIKRTC